MQETEQQSTNGWQNQGICQNFALEKIDPTYQPLFNLIVKLSFGYGKNTTNEITMEELADMSRLGKRTIVRHVKYLNDNKFIKIKKPRYSPLGGGSKPYMYSPELPRGYGKLWIKNKENSHPSGSKAKETTIETAEPEVEWNKEKNIDF